MTERATIRSRVLIASTLAFIALAIAITVKPAVQFDRSIAIWFIYHASYWRSRLMISITQGGSLPGILIVMAPVAAFLMLRNLSYWLERLLVTVFGGMLSNELLKLIV